MHNDLPLVDTIDAEAADALLSRRDAIAKGAKTSAFVSAALAFGSAPIALAALSSEVYGQSASRTVLQVLNYAFLLENLESEFYKAVLGTSAAAAVNTAFAPVRATFTQNERDAFTLIARHEAAHVSFLASAITASGGTPATYTATSFDFTGGRGSGTGPFAPATTAAGKPFLLLATQAFEDTGVRAYKGQAEFLISSVAATRNVLNAALRIHSVEARHAAHIRYLRRLASPTTTALRLSGTVRGTGRAAAGAPAGTPEAILGALDLIYAAEDTTTQAGFNAAGVTGAGAPFGANAASEAFDEPLTAAQVVAIVQPFVVATIPANA